MPTSTSRGRYDNWTRLAALVEVGRPLVDVPDEPPEVSVDEDELEDMEVVIDVEVVGIGTELKLVSVDDSVVLVVCVAGGTELKVSDGCAGSVLFGDGPGGRNCAPSGDGSGPVQVSPLGQHPTVPLLAVTQEAVGSQQLPLVQQGHPGIQQPLA